MKRCQVLIAGAGPTGLVLALWLARLGVQVRVVDKAADAGTTSRALAVQARTLELYRQLGLAQPVVSAGRQVPAVNLWTRGDKAARLAFGDVGHDLTPYAFLHIFPQDEHERLLIARLADFGVEVERRIELASFTDEGDHILAHLRGPDGAEQPCEAEFIAGCDGAHSCVRDTLGTGFPGGAYRQLFYVADIEAAGPPVDGELHIDLDEADFLAVFPLPADGRARLIGTVRDAHADHADTLTFGDVSRRAIDGMKLQVGRVNWFSTYHVHHRVTEHFRKGRAFLLGDAAHIHSPAGGQGMNTGIGDAINLAWKLKMALDGRAPDSLLDTYEDERIGFAYRLVATTDKVFSFATAEGPLADLIRTRVAPVVFPPAVAIEPVREYMFRTVSQITLNYRGHPLGQGHAGRVHGGDRLPWAKTHKADNFDTLSAPDWQVHVYGAPEPGIEAWCAGKGVTLHVFDWAPAHEQAGFAQDGLYLIRPDAYVGLAEVRAAPEALDRYLAEQGLRLN